MKSGKWKTGSKMKKLAVFDLDGTLFDTKDVNFSAYSKALEELGYKERIDYKYYCDYCNGNSYKDFIPKILGDIAKESLEAIHRRKMELYPSFLGKARMNEILFSLIRTMKGEYTIAVATTASRKNVFDILDCFSVRDCFDFFITKEDVTRVKPDPECYLKAMEKAGAGKGDTIIFEDSETGLRAAEASGADYLRVYGFN